MTSFFQTPPQLHNQFTTDSALQSCLRRLLPDEVLNDISPGLTSLGELAAGEMVTLAEAAGAQLPVHIPYDAWGRRVDEIQTSDAWSQMRRIAATEGIVATAYERQHAEYSRIHQMTRLYLFHPSSAIYSCPLAMTDGAARVLELMGDDALKERAFARLTSRDVQDFWTSGQWMTERTGGSDVGKSLSVAIPGERDGEWLLHGNKWFTSAVTSEMALTLARTDDGVPGTRGLSLFYVEIRNDDGSLNGIQVRRLKDKLGTRALPTAELDLNGTRATMLGDPGNGVRKAAALLNITRSYNAICAVGYMRRGIALVRDFAGRREAFGRLLSQQPLHLETLADLQTEFEGGLQLSMRLAELLGKEECNRASEAEQALLRILTPLAKLSTGKQTVAVCSEVLECFGGAGYVEDTGLPQLLRDAQVLPIWEGTTNILSLDVLRAGEREGAVVPLFEDCRRLLETVKSSSAGKHLEDSRIRVEQSLARLMEYCQQLPNLQPDAVQAGARSLALSLARTYAGALLLNHATWSIQNEGNEAVPRVEAARRWCRKPLAVLLSTDNEGLSDTAALALA